MHCVSSSSSCVLSKISLTNQTKLFMPDVWTSSQACQYSLSCDNDCVVGVTRCRLIFLLFRFKEVSGHLREHKRGKANVEGGRARKHGVTFDSGNRDKNDTCTCINTRVETWLNSCTVMFTENAFFVPIRLSCGARPNEERNLFLIAVILSNLKKYFSLNSV